MQIIEKYFSTLSTRQTGQLLMLGPLYDFWNQRINLISRKDIDCLYEHHVLHSLSIARIIQFRPGSVVIDAGTGGGFPGIPLAILFPDVRFILVDSIAKKTRVVSDIISKTKLMNCEVRNLRLEKLSDKADFVVCRAVAEIPILYGWMKKNILPFGNHIIKNGLLALKGGDLHEELKPMEKGWKVYNLADFFTEDYFKTKKLVYVPVSC